MTEVFAHGTHALTGEQADQSLERFADGFAQQLRSPVLHWPDEAGLHPMGFSRSGLPTHLEPWRSLWASSGNDFEVNFIPDYKILQDSGYNILAYDLRYLGLSSAANGGIASSGIFEARDVAGSLRYARSDPRFSGMAVGLFSRCLGCNSTLAAATQFPEFFSDVRVLVGAQPVTPRVIVTHQLRLAGVPAERINDLDAKVKVRTGISLSVRRPQEWARNVHTPTMLYQVHDDILTDPSDVQSIYDNLGVKDKKLHWISDTTRRWDGYLEFQRRPQLMLDWFERHL